MFPGYFSVFHPLIKGPGGREGRVDLGMRLGSRKVFDHCSLRLFLFPRIIPSYHQMRLCLGFIFSRKKKGSVMNNTNEVLQIVYVGAFVASFLKITIRVPKAIELYKECLILLDNKALGKETKMVPASSVLHKQILHTVFLDYLRTSDYTSAIECGRKFLVLLRMCGGERALEGKVVMKLAELFERQCNYRKTKDLYEKALAIKIETGDREGEETCYGHIGLALKSLGEYAKAKEYFEKALTVRKVIGNVETTGCRDYGELGTVFRNLGDNTRAEEYHMKAIAIAKDTGQRQAEAAQFGNLGLVYQSLGEHAKAIECIKKALAIRKEIGDKKGEAADYGNLGAVFCSLCKYGKANEYLERALAIRKEICDRKGEAVDYANLARLYHYLGEHVKAKEYFEKALAIFREIGYRQGEGRCYGAIGDVFSLLGKHAKAQ